MKCTNWEISQKRSITIPTPKKVTANKYNDFHTLSFIVVNYRKNKIYEN